MYVMEPDVSGVRGIFYSKLSHTSMLGVAHVMGQVQGDDASVVDNYYNVDENDGLNDMKNVKRYKQKIVSGLGEMLKQLTGECKECEEDGESDSTVYFDCEEMIEIEEAPGLSKAQKTFDQLG